ncbi:ThuA domain-containing protein [Streptosporangium sp. NPDC049248]|uniref:ThuA domain-containing protein n=1 Tax=Streptosporangium sp. NPDC049248 TaxID=3155651 RepID=UPI00341250CD
MPEVAARSALIISGGVAHDFPTSSAILAEVLGEAGFETAVTTDVEGACRGLTGERRPALLVFNMLRWTMRVERYAHLRADWSISLSPPAREALAGHVRHGGGILAMHGASICFDDWPGWRDLLGGVWRWDRSSHPPLDGPVRVTVATGSHPIVDGIGDFDVVDEVYGFLDSAPDVRGLMSSPHGGTDHPLLWAREVGAGRVVYDALGHDGRSYQVPEHRRVVQRSALWASGHQLS